MSKHLYNSDWNANPNSEYSRQPDDIEVDDGYHDAYHNSQGTPSPYQVQDCGISIDHNAEYFLQHNHGQSINDAANGNHSHGHQSNYSDKDTLKLDDHDQRGYHTGATATERDPAFNHREREYYNAIYHSVLHAPDEDTPRYNIEGQSEDTIQLNFGDLEDTNYFPTARKSKALITTIAVTIILPVIGIATLHSYQPQFTAAEIIQSGSYSHQPRSVLIMAELADKDNCLRKGNCVALPSALLEAEIKPVNSGSFIQEIQALHSIEQSHGTQSAATPLSIRERQDNADIRVPQRLVQRQWSIIRDTPDMAGNIITSLAKDTDVNIINVFDNWYEVTVDDKGVHGYMHKSTLNQ